MPPVRPRIVGEIEDSALLMAFGQEGAGLFAASAAIEREIQQQHGVVVVGQLEGVRERFYAISGERKVTHPAVVTIADAARHRVFG